MSDDGWEDDGWAEEGTTTPAAVMEVTESGDGVEEHQDQEEGGRGGGDNRCRNCRQVRMRDFLVLLDHQLCCSPLKVIIFLSFLGIILSKFYI